MKMRLRLWVWLLVAIPLAGCTNDPAARLDADAGDDKTIAPEEPLTLSATATGGVEPYTYHWSVAQQPTDADVDLTGREMSPTLSPGVLSTFGRYQFRVRVTDAAGVADASFVSIEVGGDVEITASARDALRAVGESTPLEVIIDGTTTGFTDKRVEWEVVEGEATLDDPTSRTPELTIDAEQSAKAQVTYSARNEDGEEQTGIAVVTVVGVLDATPQVVLETTGGVNGTMVIELFGEEAPDTVANFLRYVDAGFYDLLLWHRVDAGFVIQTGAFERIDEDLVRRVGVRPPIDSEADNGKTHERGTVGLALRDSDADSGDSQFFINLEDNPSLDTGAPAYTVFGRVVKGLDTVADAIAEVVTIDEGGLTNVPKTDILVERITRIDEEIPTDGGTNGPLIELDVTAEADDPLRVIGQTTTLRAVVADPPEGLTYRWTVVSGSATFDNATAIEPTVTITSADTVQLRVTVRGEGVETTTADVFVVGVEDALPRVVISNTGAVTGDIVLELLTEDAPITTANFLRYVDDRFFDGIVWHRVDDGFVIQGGAFESTPGGLVPREGARPPIPSEANNGNSNIRGNVAMALRGTDADSGSNQFFVNLGDNSSLDNGSPPFTVFASVVEGMDVVDDISTVAVGSDALSGLNDVPVEDIVMSRVRREGDTAGGELAAFSEPAAADTAERAFAAANLMMDLRVPLEDVDNPQVIITGGLRTTVTGNLQTLAAVTFYDPQTQTFSNQYTTPDGAGPNTYALTTPRSHHMQFTLRDGRVVIMGGETGASGDSIGTPTNEVELFDPATGELTDWFPMIVSRGRGHAGTRMPARRIVTIGDATWEVFDTTDGAREGPYQLLRTRLGLAAVTVHEHNGSANDHRALAIAGEGTGANTMELLNPTDRTRSLQQSTLSRELRDLAAVNIDTNAGTILIVGGIDLTTDDSVADAYLFDSKNDTIASIDPLPERTGGAARQQIILFNERYAVVLGGEEVQDGASTALDYYAIFDVETETWVENGQMSSPRANFALAPLSATSALLVGGSAPTDPPSEMRADAEILTIDAADDE